MSTEKADWRKNNPWQKCGKCTDDGWICIKGDGWGLCPCRKSWLARRDSAAGVFDRKRAAAGER